MLVRIQKENLGVLKRPKERQRMIEGWIKGVIGDNAPVNII